jgi:HK97 family phage prohead protease/HK97 family phage major capsid protein
MAEMETREFEVRADLEERTITGLAVPYGQDANIGGTYMERFVPGAITDVTDVKLFYGHEEPIGKVLTGRDTEAGYEITAKVSDTARGNEVMTLMRDGVLNKFSVGFVPLESERDGSTVTRTKVSLKEVSVVPFPAFAGANITEVREDGGTPAETSEPQPEQENPMSENIELDVRAVQDEVAEIRRLVEAGQTVATPAPMGSEFRSQGEFAKALVAGDSKAQEFARTASTSADAAVVAPWFGYINTLIANNRPTVSAFSRAPLPATGLTVEYSKIDSNTLSVTQQLNTDTPPTAEENVALAFGNLTFETVSTPVKTYGGYTSFSRQYVERSQVNTLDQVFQGLALAYAGASNAALVAAIGALDYTGKIFDADGQTASSLAEGIANGAGYIFTNTGLRPEFILTGVDGYVKLAKVAAGDGRPVLLADGNGVNNIGTMNVTGLAGSVFGLPIIVDPAIGSGIVYMANSNAVITMESAGAPVRLTDGDITTLTDSVSVYGYMAIATPREGAIVKLDVTA